MVSCGVAIDPGNDLSTLRRVVFVRGWLVLAGLVVGWQGMRYLVDPASVVAGNDVAVGTVDALHVVRTGYAGGLIAVATMALLGAFRRRLRRAALVTMGVAMVALVAGRVVSIVIDGAPSVGLMRLLYVEIVLLIGTLVAGATAPRG